MKNRFQYILHKILSPLLRLHIGKEDTPEQAVRKVQKYSSRNAWIGAFFDWLIGGVVALLLAIIYQAIGFENSLFELWMTNVFIIMATWYTVSTTDHNAKIIYRDTVNYIAEEGRKKQ